MSLGARRWRHSQVLIVDDVFDSSLTLLRANRSIPFRHVASSVTSSLLILNEHENLKPMVLAHDVHNLALFTDLYELTMLQAYVEVGMEEQATVTTRAALEARVVCR